MPISMTPLLSTWAKSLTLRSKPLAMRGVPRLLLEISSEASEVIFVLRIAAARVIIFCSVTAS
jgi:hypothetical protein